MTTTIEQSAVCAELRRLAEPVVKHYHNDIAIDCEAIENNPGTPFLWYVRECGTDILFLLPIESYPAKWETLPYLFGTADRRHLLSEVVSMAKYWANPMNAKNTAFYCNGKRFKPVTHDEAISIATEYARRIERIWDNE